MNYLLEQFVFFLFVFCVLSWDQSLLTELCFRTSDLCQAHVLRHTVPTNPAPYTCHLRINKQTNGMW